MGQVTEVEIAQQAVQPLTLFLILRAFSSGCTALTGVEAISNGISAFKEPRSQNAAKTLIAMSSILMVMFVGITLLAHQVGALPSHEETVISQIARVEYIAQLRRDQPDIYIHLILGTLAAETFWEQALHRNSTLVFRMALRHIEGVVITTVPFQLHHEINQRGSYE